jgi:hypothetical protein
MTFIPKPQTAVLFLDVGDSTYEYQFPVYSENVFLGRKGVLGSVPTRKYTLHLSEANTVTCNNAHSGSTNLNQWHTQNSCAKHNFTHRSSMQRFFHSA